MELSKCLGCMDDFQGYPCPHCGYDPVKEKRPEYALPQETILAGKYLVGRVRPGQPQSRDQESNLVYQ